MARSYIFQCLLLSFVAWAVLFVIWYSYTQNEPPISDDVGLKRFACDDTILSHFDTKWFAICFPTANKHIVVLPSSASCRFRSTDLHHLNVEGDYVVVRNNRVTNWTFVNNTLQNENGKCLTAWAQRSTYLFESECSEGWQGQTWIRHGLQIINGYRLCLSTRDNYVIQDFCKSSAPFLWRHLTCQRLIA